MSQKWFWYYDQAQGMWDIDMVDEGPEWDPSASASASAEAAEDYLCPNCNYRDDRNERYDLYGQCFMCGEVDVAVAAVAFAAAAAAAVEAAAQRQAAAEAAAEALAVAVAESVLIEPEEPPTHS